MILKRIIRTCYNIFKNRENIRRGTSSTIYEVIEDAKPYIKMDFRLMCYKYFKSVMYVCIVLTLMMITILVQLNFVEFNIINIGDFDLNSKMQIVFLQTSVTFVIVSFASIAATLDNKYIYGEKLADVIFGNFYTKIIFIFIFVLLFSNIYLVIFDDRINYIILLFFVSILMLTYISLNILFSITNLNFKFRVVRRMYFKEACKIVKNDKYRSKKLKNLFSRTRLLIRSNDDKYMENIEFYLMLIELLLRNDSTKDYININPSDVYQATFNEYENNLCLDFLTLIVELANTSAIDESIEYYNSFLEKMIYYSSCIECVYLVLPNKIMLRRYLLSKNFSLSVKLSENFNALINKTFLLCRVLYQNDDETWSADNHEIYRSGLSEDHYVECSGIISEIHRFFMRNINLSKNIKDDFNVELSMFVKRELLVFEFENLYQSFKHEDTFPKDYSPLYSNFYFMTDTIYLTIKSMIDESDDNFNELDEKCLNIMLLKYNEDQVYGIYKCTLYAFILILIDYNKLDKSNIKDDIVLNRYEQFIRFLFSLVRENKNKISDTDIKFLIGNYRRGKEEYRISRREIQYDEIDINSTISAVQKCMNNSSCIPSKLIDENIEKKIIKVLS